MKSAILVMGPAGSGKSTFCSTLLSHFQNIKRSSVHLVNLDPAAENFEFPPTIDIKNLISLQDVMEELDYGPNGGLVYCLEYLLQNSDWLEEQLQDYDEDYLVIDCPGQIELYTHFPIMKDLIRTFETLNYRICGVYLLDAQFIEDTSKFFSGVMSAMSAMIQLEIPHVNILTKMDLVGESCNPARVTRFLEADTELLLEDLNTDMSPKYKLLNTALLRLIEEFNLVSFIPMNISDEESIELVLAHIDHAIQYGEDLEPKEPEDEEVYSDED